MSWRTILCDFLLVLWEEKERKSVTKKKREKGLFLKKENRVLLRKEGFSPTEKNVSKYLDRKQLSLVKVLVSCCNNWNMHSLGSFWMKNMLVSHVIYVESSNCKMHLRYKSRECVKC